MRVLGCYTDHPEDRDLPYEPYTDPTDGMDPLLCSRHCFGKVLYVPVLLLAFRLLPSLGGLVPWTGGGAREMGGGGGGQRD